jgi:hypothetical protein
MNIRDIKSGDYVAFVYKGNTAIAEIDDDNAHFQYAVGLWFAPDIIGKKNSVWLNDNLYHINNVFDIEKTLRHANAEEVKYFEQVVDKWESVHLDKEVEEEEERPRLPGIKVVGKIDLDKIKGTSDSPYMLEKKKTERRKEFQISGYYPTKGEVVKIQKKFKNVGKRSGLAIMKDASHFYVAIAFFPDKPTFSIFDSEEDGLLPENTFVYKITDDMPLELLTANVIKEQYADDIKKYDILEQERIKAQKEEEERKRLAEQKAKEEQKKAEQEKEENPSFDYTPADDPLIHVKYIRGEKKLMDMSYPVIDELSSPSRRYHIMYVFAKTLARMKIEHALTYKMSYEYFDELKSRLPHYNKLHKWKDFISSNRRMGVINYPYTYGIYDNLFYSMGGSEDAPIITMFLTRGNTLLFYGSIRQQGSFAGASTDYFLHSNLKDRNIPANKMVEYCTKLLVAHLQMEADTDNIVNEIVKYTGDTWEKNNLDYKEVNDNSVITYNDIVIRDSSWYTSIWEQRMIPVSGYLSHRWCGTGDNKVLTEVTVRPHVRNGYTKTAKVLNSK